MTLFFAFLLLADLVKRPCPNTIHSAMHCWVLPYGDYKL